MKNSASANRSQGSSVQTNQQYKHTGFADADDCHEPTQLDEFVERLEPVLKHITAHRFLWGFTVVCAFVAWNRGLMLLYALVAFLLAVLIVSHLLRLLNLRGLAVTGHFITEQGLVTHGTDEIYSKEPVAVQLKTASRFAKHFLHVETAVYRVTQVHTASVLNKVQDTRLFILHAKGEDDFINELQLNRGVYRLQSAWLSCAYPFGLLEARQQFDLQTGQIIAQKKKSRSAKNSSTDKANADSLITKGTDFDSTYVDLYVLPRWFSINSLPVESAHSSGQDELTSSKKGGCDEFMEIRPYRRGDAFKTVHWGASARQVSRGKDFMVKEYATFDTPRMLIVLNQFDINHHASMDAMVSSALAVASYFAGIGHQVDMFGYDGASQSLSDFWHMRINKTISSDKLRKLAELDSMSNYIFDNASADSGSSSTQHGNSHGNNYSKDHSTSHNRQFSNSALKAASYDDALQSVLSQQPNANVLLTFYSHSPSQQLGGAGVQLMEDKTQYQVVITRKSNSNSTSTMQQQQPNQRNGYIKHSNLVHEFQLNANDSMTEWQAVFASYA